MQSFHALVLRMILLLRILGLLPGSRWHELMWSGCNFWYLSASTWCPRPFGDSRRTPTFTLPTRKEELHNQPQSSSFITILDFSYFALIKKSIYTIIIPYNFTSFLQKLICDAPFLVQILHGSNHCILSAHWDTRAQPQSSAKERCKRAVLKRFLRSCAEDLFKVSFLVHLLRMPHSVHGLNEPMLCEALSDHQLSVDAASSCAMLLRSELQSQKTKPSDVLFTSTAAPRPLKAGPLQAGYICEGLFASSPEADGLGWRSCWDELPAVLEHPKLRRKIVY